MHPVWPQHGPASQHPLLVPSPLPSGNFLFLILPPSQGGAQTSSLPCLLIWQSPRPIAGLSPVAQNSRIFWLMNRMVVQETGVWGLQGEGARVLQWGLCVLALAMKEAGSVLSCAFAHADYPTSTQRMPCITELESSEALCPFWGQSS